VVKLTGPYHTGLLNDLCQNIPQKYTDYTDDVIANEHYHDVQTCEACAGTGREVTSDFGNRFWAPITGKHWGRSASINCIICKGSGTAQAEIEPTKCEICGYIQEEDNSCPCYDEHVHRWTRWLDPIQRMRHAMKGIKR
jgi:hypothetical protein